MIRKKHQLFQRAKQIERTEDWDKYRLQKRATQKAVRQAHWSYVNNVLESALEEGNSKPFWKYIKSKRTDNKEKWNTSPRQQIKGRTAE
jgi:hypothetical protein